VDERDLRRLSKAMFGNSYRLEIAAAIAAAPTELVHAHELSAALVIPSNLVSKQLKDFVAAGVLDDVDQIEGQRYRYFRRLHSPYWTLCWDLLGALRASEARPYRAAAAREVVRQSSISVDAAQQTTTQTVSAS
jgi:hypothetical protein